MPPVSDGPDLAALHSTVRLVPAAEMEQVESGSKRGARRQGDHREPLPRKARKRDNGQSGRVDATLLSFFDGIGTAALIFKQVCDEKSWRGHMLLWESDEDLAAVTAEHFPAAEQRGDLDSDCAADILARLEQIDPEHAATIIIAAGPPCHEYSRIRASAPGVNGEEGSKFVRFAKLVKELEASWPWPQAVLIVENVLPQNKADVRALEQALAASAVMHDSSDFGVIARPRLWWTRIPWQQMSHRSDCPAQLRWATHQGIPRVTFVASPDNLDDFDLQGMKWPSVLSDRAGVLPCLTTPSEDPAGRPAPRSSKGKVDSQTQARWLGDNRRYAPWHYQDKNLFVDEKGAYCLATADIKEQLHHLPRGWTHKLSDRARHRAADSSSFSASCQRRRKQFVSSRIRWALMLLSAWCASGRKRPFSMAQAYQSCVKQPTSLRLKIQRTTGMPRCSVCTRPSRRRKLNRVSGNGFQCGDISVRCCQSC